EPGHQGLGGTCPAGPAGRLLADLRPSRGLNAASRGVLVVRGGPGTYHRGCRPASASSTASRMTSSASGSAARTGSSVTPSRGVARMRRWIGGLLELAERVTAAGAQRLAALPTEVVEGLAVDDR